MASTTDAGLIIDSRAGVTTTQTSSDQFNYGSRGLVLFINMINAGTGSVTFTVQGKDNISGRYYTLLASAAVVAAGLTVLRVYPGLTASPNATASDVLPFTWNVLATANNANSTIYTVSGSMVA